MATRTISDSAGTRAWGDTDTWVEGAVPTAADEVVATATSGNVTIAANAVCRSIDLTDYTGVLTHNAACSLTIGDATAPTGNNALVFPSAGWTYTLGSVKTSSISFASTSATALNVNPGGQTFGNTTFGAGVSGGSHKLTGHILLGSTATLTLTRGTFDANGFNVTFGLFSSANSNTRSIIMGAGTWTGTGGNNVTVWNTGSITNLTVSRGNPIVFSHAGSTGTRIFVPAASTGPTDATSFDIIVTAGTDAVTMTNGRVITFDGFAGTFNNNPRTLFGDFTVTSNSSGMTFAAGVNATTFGATSGTKTITTGGKTLDFPVTINGVGGTFQLGDNLTLGATRALTITNGAFDANNHNVDCGSVSSSNSNVRSILMGSGTWTVRNSGTAWTTATATNLTFNAGTSTLVLADTNSRTINTNVTFYNLSCVVATARTLTFTDGTAPGASNSLTLQGASGQLLTLAGSSTGGWSLGVPSMRTLDYLSVSRSTATGNAAYAAHSTDGGNNSAWYFAAPANTVAPAVTGTPAVGETLSCSTGTWDNLPTGYAYQWTRDGSDIGGATSATYVVRVADEGADVGCTVTASNPLGSNDADSNTVEIPAPPVADFTGTPTSGTAPLTTAFTYTGTGGTPDDFHWEKNDGGGWVDFDGTPTAEDPTEDFTAGTWSVRVTASNGGGSDTHTETDYIESSAPTNNTSVEVVPFGWEFIKPFRIGW